jgi:hypothetical protein
MATIKIPTVLGVSLVLSVKFWFMLSVNFHLVRRNMEEGYYPIENQGRTWTKTPRAASKTPPEVSKF